MTTTPIGAFRRGRWAGLFAAAGRPAERRLVDDPRKVVVTVSEAEAEILAGVLGQTTLSLSAFVDEAMRQVGGER